MDRYDPAWLHVKFIEGSASASTRGVRGVIRATDLASVNADIDRAQALHIRRHFTGHPAALRALKASGEARSGVTGPDLSLCSTSRSTANTRVAQLVNDLNVLLRSRSPTPSDRGERRHRRAGAAAAAHSDACSPPPTSPGNRIPGPSADRPQRGRRLDRPRGHGEGQHFIDVELCWTEDHETSTSRTTSTSGARRRTRRTRRTGTAVLGKSSAEQRFGINGFSPKSVRRRRSTVAEWPTCPLLSGAIRSPLDRRRLVIELQIPPGKLATRWSGSKATTT